MASSVLFSRFRHWTSRQNASETRKKNRIVGPLFVPHLFAIRKGIFLFLLILKWKNKHYTLSMPFAVLQFNCIHQFVKMSSFQLVSTRRKINVNFPCIEESFLRTFSRSFQTNKIVIVYSSLKLFSHHFFNKTDQFVFNYIIVNVRNIAEVQHKSKTNEWYDCLMKIA